MTYFGNKKLDMKSVRVETEDNYYDFTCDEEFIGGYDNDLKDGSTMSCSTWTTAPAG